MATGNGNYGALRRLPTLCLLALAVVRPCEAASPGASLRTVVSDEAGKPLAHVVVYAVPAQPDTLKQGAPNALMDQQHNAFVPHVLVVQTGTSVLFPNNDTVSHHVYSFSEPKAFEFPLYKGNAQPPVVFDRPGVVVLGCNIHDGMLGYILVVDTPHFTSTADGGAATLDELPAGDYTVQVWTPRARPNDLPAPQRVTLGAADSHTLAFRFAAKLLPDHDAGSSALSWDRY